MVNTAVLHTHKPCSELLSDPFAIICQLESSLALIKFSSKTLLNQLKQLPVGRWAQGLFHISLWLLTTRYQP